MCISNNVRRRSLSLAGRLPTGGLAAKATPIPAIVASSPSSDSNAPWTVHHRPTTILRPGPLPVPRPLVSPPPPSPLQLPPSRQQLQQPHPQVPPPPSSAHHQQQQQPRCPPQLQCPSNGGSSSTTGSSSSSSSRRNKHDLHVDHPYRDHALDAPSDEKHVTRGGVTEPFPLKLHRMLDQIERDGYGGIVGWQTHGRCFVVHRPREFVDIVMPKYFKQTKFASFQRQLNLYGFSRITAGLDRGGYYHELFLRGKRFLTHRIHRMRVKGTRVRMASSPDREPNFYAMPPLCAARGPCSRPCCPPAAAAAPPAPQCCPPPHPGAALMNQPAAAPASVRSYGPCAPVPQQAQQQQQVCEAQQVYEPAAPVSSGAGRVSSAMVTPVVPRPSLSCAGRATSQSSPPVFSMEVRAAQNPQRPTPPPAPRSEPLRGQPRAAETSAADEDDDLDEVMFEGRIFHYLKPFEEALFPQRQQQQQKLPPTTAECRAPSPPKSAPIFHLADRAPSSALPAQFLQQGEQRPPSVVSSSPVFSVPIAPKPVEAMTPLPPPPPLDVPSSSSLFETASRLAEMVYKKPVGPERMVVRPDPAPSSSSDGGRGRPDPAPRSSDGDRKRPPAVAGAATPLPVGSSENAVVSDDEHGLSRNSSEAELTQSSQGEKTDAYDEDGFSSDDFDMPDMVSREMASFFATLDVPLELDDNEKKACLNDDIGFGYMIERALE